MVKAAAPPELQPIAALPQGSFVKAICGYAVLMARLVRTAAKTSSLMNRARRSDRVSYSRPRSLFFAIVATVFNGNRDEQRARSRRSEEHTSELQSHLNLVCRLLLEKKKDESNQ